MIKTTFGISVLLSLLSTSVESAFIKRTDSPKFLAQTTASCADGECECSQSIEPTCIQQFSVDFGFEEYFNSDEYLEKLASAKLAELWEKIEEVPTVICQKFTEMSEAFSQNPCKPFNHSGDEMPGNSPQKMRMKLFHQQGLHGKVKYRNTKEDNSYTGIFQGGDYGIIRFSESNLQIPGMSGANPSFAIKFLRDGIHSGNFLSQISFEGTDSWDFFAQDFTNHVPKPADDTCGMQTVTRKHASGSSRPFSNGSMGWAEYDQFGNEEEEPWFPYKVVFKPRHENLTITTDGASRFWEQYDQYELEGDEDQRVLFDVYAIDDPFDDEEKIGELTLESHLTQSLWGDERLFFEHTRFASDFQIRGKGKANIAWKQETPKYSDTMPAWPGKDFKHVSVNWETPTSTAYEVFTNDADTLGCPFQWIIDCLSTGSCLKDDIESDIEEDDE